MKARERTGGAPPEVRADPKAFRWVDGAWMRLDQIGEYRAANLPQRVKAAVP